MVHSEVNLNICVVSIAPSTSHHSYHFTPSPIQKTALFCMFSLFSFSFFQGVSWPHLPLCADVHVVGFRLQRTDTAIMMTITMGEVSYMHVTNA